MIRRVKERGIKERLERERDGEGGRGMKEELGKEVERRKGTDGRRKRRQKDWKGRR